MEVVDWIYKDAVAKALPFAVYTYTPPVYDYHYEYLLWWKGSRKYNLLPAEFSYRPEKLLTHNIKRNLCPNNGNLSRC